MYQADLIKTGFRGLVGFSPSDDPSEVSILQELYSSSSGLYFNEDGHPLITLKNLQVIAPNYDNIVYQAWDNLTTYNVGDIITHNDLKWEAVQNVNAGIEPGTDSLYWETYDPLSKWLQKRIDQAAINVIRQWHTKKMLLKEGRSLLTNKVLYTGVGNIKNTIENTGLKVGLELNPVRVYGSLAKLTRVSFQFTAPVTFNLYLFHSSQEEPIETKQIAYTKTGGVQWFDLNYDLKFFDTELDAGGTYSLAYNQDDLGEVKAINRVINWDYGPECTSCHASDYAAFNLFTKYMKVFAFGAKPEDGNVITQYDNRIFYNDQNAGMNLEYSIYCDYTDFLIGQKQLFSAAILERFCIDALERMAYNPEQNISRNSTTFNYARIVYDLDGTENDKENSLRNKYERTLEAINLSTEGLNKSCLSCRKGTYNIRSI